MLGILLSGCGQDGAGGAVGSGDSTRSAVEGRVEPAHVEAKVYLSRGGEIDSTVTRDGWFQLAGIGYGLYVLEAKAEGYGGSRQLVSVGGPMVLVGPMVLEAHPWPIAQVFPRDSLVLRDQIRGGLIGITFSRYMDRASVEAALRMEPACTLSLEWQQDRSEENLGDFLIVNFQPADLGFGEPHALILDASARTREGHALEKAFAFPVVRRYAIPGEGAIPSFGNQILNPVDSIRIDFPQAVDMASVADRIYLFPSIPFTPVWDSEAKSLRLVPETRWTAGDYLTVGIDSGYRSSTGMAGAAVSRRLYINAFGILSSRQGIEWGFENENLTLFNMPVDLASLEYGMDPAVTVAARQTAPDRILWSFRGGEAGRTYILRIESLRSRLGDSLASPIGIRYVPTGPVSNYRFLDSTQGRDGLRPHGDTLKVELSRSAYLRLHASTFSLVPDLPVTVRLQRNPEGGGVLSAFSSQPWPAGTGFRLVPDTGALPEDTVAFSTRFLAAEVRQPFQGETAVESSRSVELLWNTLIDTIGFASRLRFDPPVDSLRIEQDTLAGGHRTRIRHAPFSPATRYLLEVSGVTDLFSQGLRDTLEVRFQTRP